MKPEYIGIGNFDTDNYVYVYCKCPLPVDYAIKWPRIKDGKPHRYTCKCEDCGTEVGVISKSYGPDVYAEKEDKEMNISMYEVVYKSERLSGDKTNAKGLICAHSNREALYLAEDLVKNIKERMKKDNEDVSDKVVDHNNVDDLDSGT